MNSDNSPAQKCPVPVVETPSVASGGSGNSTPASNGVFALPQITNSQNALCSEFLQDLAQRFGIRAFVETGTYLGGTAEAAAEIFEDVHTIELSAELAQQATARLVARKNVRVYQGDSLELLPQILKRLSGPALFWLDGHWSTGRTARGKVNTPILDELRAIKESGIRDAVILIDDLRLFGKPSQQVDSSSSLHGYPDLNEIHRAVMAIDSSYQFLVLGDVALACPANVALTPSPVVMALTLSRLFDGHNLSLDEIFEAEIMLGHAEGEERELIRALSSERADVEQCGLGLHYRFWHALILLGEKKFIEAGKQLVAADRLGFNHWRLRWYLALALVAAGHKAVAADVLDQLFILAPEFSPARQLREQLRGPQTEAVLKTVPSAVQMPPRPRNQCNGQSAEPAELLPFGSGLCGEDVLLAELSGRKMTEAIRVACIVGAHRFQEKALLDRMFPKLERIYLFEPVPELYALLQRNAGCDPRVRVYPYAISDVNGPAQFHVTDNEAASSSLLPLGRHQEIFPHAHVAHQIQVETRTLESVIATEHLEEPDLLFLDVQGAEYRILASLSPTMRTRLALIYTEASKEELFVGARNLDALEELLAPEFVCLGFAPLAASCPTRGNSLFANRALAPKETRSSFGSLPPPVTAELSSAALAFVQQAEDHFNRAELASAADCLESALKLAPDRVELLTALGSLRFQIGDAKAARASFARACQLQPDSPALLVKLAAAAVQSQQVEEFESALGRALELDPENYNGLRLLADLNLRQGRFTDAAKTYAQIIQRAPKDRDSLMALGRCLFESGELETAAATFERVLKVARGHSLAAENLGVVRKKLGVQKAATPAVPAPAASHSSVNQAALIAERQFWDVETMRQAMFERVCTGPDILRMTKEEQLAAWEKSALDSVNQVLEGLAASPEWRILEIGCGVGRILKPLRERFAHVDGVDISPKMIEFAQNYLANARGSGSVRHNSGSDLSGFPDATYDLVFSTIVFQHIRSASVVRSYFREALRVLKPGGHFRIQVHQYEPCFGRFDEEAQPGVQHGFMGNGYTVEELRGLLEGAGFAIASVSQQGQWIWATAERPTVAAAMPAAVETAPSGGSHPLISVLVSTYKSERFMRGCLEDLEAQTIADQIEIIVVDSGSPENERAIVEEFQGRYPGIKYLRTEQRETIHAALNRGITAARGKYLTIACTDDRHRPDALEQMAGILESHPQVDLLYGDSYVTNQANAGWGEAQIKGRFYWPDFDVRLLFDVCMMGPHPLWRRSVHEKHGLFDPAARSAGDYELWLRLAVAGCKMLHLPDVVGLYLERPDSVSLSDTNLNWKESEAARDRYWPAAWGKRPPTAWHSCEKPVTSPASKSRRVLLACDYFWPSVGGVEIYVEDLARNLQAAGCAVEVACRQLPERSSLDHRGLRIHEFECVNEHGVLLSDPALTQLRKLLSAKRFDSVLVLSQPDNWLRTVVAEAKTVGTPVVVLPSINETNLVEWRKNGTTAEVARFLRVPDYLVTVSENGRDAQFCHQAGRMASFIPHAVEPDADAKNFRRRAGIAADRPLLVMVANFWPVKNHLELLQILAKDEGDWELVIIGHRIGHLGDYHAQVVEQAAKDPRVKLLSGLPRMQAAAAIRDADLLLVPSKGESAGPLVVLQAMCYGTPWLATPECNAVGDEAGGVVAQLDRFPAVIRALLASPAHRRELGALGREHYQHSFTWKQTIPAFLALMRGQGSLPDLRMPADLRERSRQLREQVAKLCDLSLSRLEGKESGPDDSTLLFSVIIPTHNRSAVLLRCLDALARQTVPSSRFEVLVSDDGSTDDTASKLAGYAAPYAFHFLRQENRGPAAARNRAIEQARGHYLLILNDDAILEPNAMALHLAGHQSRPREKISVLGRFAFPRELTATPFGHALENSTLLFNYSLMKAGEKYDFNCFYTCNLSIPRQALLDAGMFDESFTGPAAEDIELGYRLFQRGYGVVYEPKCVAWHYHDMTPARFCRTHRTRGEAAVTLMLRQPDAPWYTGFRFAELRPKLAKLQKEYPPVERIVFLIEQANQEPVPNATGLAEKAAQMLPLLQFLQQYHELEGMLASPHLLELAELRSERAAKGKQSSGTPLVSVIVTCFNYGRFLAEAVESVAAQTFRDFEVIIVNDGSTDDSAKVAEQLVAKHKDSCRLFTIHTQNTGQPAAARNIGIAAARGRYILCLDADDKIDHTYLEKAVRVMEQHPETGVVYSHIRHFGTLQSVYQCGAFELATLARDNVLPYCSLYRREIWDRLGGYRLNIRGYEDWDFWLGMAELGWKGELIPEPLFFYRKHEAGLLATSNPRREALLATLAINHPHIYGPQLVAEKARFLKTTDAKPFLRVTYLISSIQGVTGGNQTLLQQAEYLRRRGHDVTIVTYTPKPDWFHYPIRVIQVPVDQPMASSVPPSDVVVATYFTNAHELLAIAAPVKIYYAQGDQFVFGDATMAGTPQNQQFQGLSRASYLLPGIRFVPNSRNLASAVEKLCGRQPDAILPVCTDQTTFRPLQRSLPGSKFRLLIVGPDSRGTDMEPLLFKGIQDTLDALQILAKRYPHFTAVRMSGTSPDIFAKFPCEFYVAPDNDTKTALFGTAHILIYASHYDSCPRPPQEAMAAGCAVVCTATAGALEYCRDGENSLLVPVQSPAAIADAVERLIQDHALREKLVQGGLATAHEFPREREWNEWEAMLFRFVHEATGKNGQAVKQKPALVKSSVSVPPSKSTGITLPPCALVGHLGQARALQGQKKLRGAWESTLATIKSRPFHPEAYLLLAQLAQAAGDATSSRRCAQHARSLAPEWKPVKRFLKSNLRGNTRPEWLVLPDSLAPRSTLHAPRLSVCLIVKDEEKFLGQCLASVRGLADQIVVVDTGSTDRTVAIAKEHGAEVYDFAWCDDFSAARNAALELATGDWVLMLDADEELPPASHEALRKLLAVPSVMAWRLPIIDVGRENEGCCYVPRLFRNAPALFYIGRVHEQVFTSIEVRRQEWGLDNRLGDAALRHHGYLPEVVKDRNKIERNLLLLEKAIVELPDEPNLLMNYGLELARSGQLEAGIEHYRKAFDLMSAQESSLVIPETREMLLTQFCTQLTALRRFDEIIRVLTSPLAKSGGLTPSLHFGLGLAHLELKQSREAADQMRQCLAKRGQPSLAPINPEIHKAGPHHCLALCLAQLGDTDAAAAEFCLAIEDDPQSRPARFDYARFLAAPGQLVEALNLLFELAKQKADDSAVWVLGGQIALSRPEFLEVALDWTAEASGHFPQDLAILRQRAEVLTLANRCEEALPLWRQLRPESDPVLAAALVLCETAANDDQFSPPLPLEAQISREFLKWYQRLIQFNGRPTVEAVNARIDALQSRLPSVAHVLREALAQANVAVAA
jgi:FkbM family methyltransferase